MANETSKKASAQGSAPSVAAVAGHVAPAQPGVKVGVDEFHHHEHRLDPEQFRELQRTLIVAALAAGKTFRADFAVSPANLKKLRENADVILTSLEGRE